nr:hypothetical protein [Anaeromyxobacter sp. PSR-1]
MKAEREPMEAAGAGERRDIVLPGGCLLCDGDLEVRLGERGHAASFCPRCHWISHPHMRRADGAVHVIHPAGGLA